MFPLKPQKRGLWILLIVALALAAGGLQQVVRHALAVQVLPTGTAEWIWDEGRQRQIGPWVMWAVRDFELPEVPDSVQLLVEADESYVVYVDGRRVGSDVYRDGMPLDRYQLAPWLEPGAHRIAVELRSGRGAGGLLLALVDGTRGEQVLGTDGKWTVFYQDHPGILEGWLPVSEGEPAFSWGLPPVGRWGVPSRVVDRPTFSQAVGEPWELRPVAPHRVAVGGEVVEVLTSRGRERSRRLPWRPAAAIGVPTGSAGRGRGGAILFDWGREVTGYLTLEHRAGGGRLPGLLQVGTELPEVDLARPDAAVLTVSGGAIWRDELPRRFRYALVLGADSVVAARVEPVAPELLDRLPAPPPPETGLLGLRSPRLRTPVENEVRRTLKGLAGGAGRKDL
jgi:hypothetical protein